MIPDPTGFLPTTEFCIFGCLGQVLEFREYMKRPRADLSITVIGRIGTLTAHWDISIRITGNKRG